MISLTAPKSTARHDRPGGLDLRVDDEVDTQEALLGKLAGVVVETADAGDLGLDRKLGGDDPAGDHVHLVGVGCGDKIVGGGGSCLSEDLAAGSLARHDHTVQGV